ncbi:uncharacterized protein LOC118438802 [Folsomia candida]|uniref:uncharacterized protein LOC118438802 n=1 Tax=Folsomia candida TaxID=158441 RepID=UPI001604A384|nr:uncharacterized protein LOC118438802 [Folsomia candida]
MSPLLKICGTIFPLFFVFPVILSASVTELSDNYVQKVGEEAHSIKFRSARFIQPEKIPISNITSGLYLIEPLVQYQHVANTTFIRGSEFTSITNQSTSLVPSSGFVSSVFLAYKNHHNLVIRPDDIWTAILIQYSYYVNAHAEELRPKFVNFPGKKALGVTYLSSVSAIPIEDFISKIVTQIKNHTHPNVTNWLFPNFSTTTPQDSAVAGAAIMATMKSYFEYNMSTIFCGIPAITVKGSGQDWRKVRDKVSLLPAFSRENDTQIAAWTRDLVKVLDQFITLTETKIVNVPFWEGIVKHRVYGGCGATTYINGWITLFSVFDADGKWQVESWRAETFEIGRDFCPVGNGTV